MSYSWIDPALDQLETGKPVKKTSFKKIEVDITALPQSYGSLRRDPTPLRELRKNYPGIKTWFASGGSYETVAAAKIGATKSGATAAIIMPTSAGRFSFTFGWEGK